LIALHRLDRQQAAQRFNLGERRETDRLALCACIIGRWCFFTFHILKLILRFKGFKREKLTLALFLKFLLTKGNGHGLIPAS
jgi:hypothetical protein